LTPPASSTLKRLARASAPIIAPPASAIAGSKVAAVASAEGKAVAVSPLRSSIWLATPRLASLSYSVGMPSRGMPAIAPADGTMSAGMSGVAGLCVGYQ